MRNPLPSNSSSRAWRVRRGATWPDILAVVIVVALLIAITLPMLLSARATADRAHCTDHLRDIWDAINTYAQNNGGRLPSTRPGIGPLRIPDISNSGFAASDPFGPDGPADNNVPAAIFLLIREGLLDPSTVICPGSGTQQTIQATPDTFDGKTARQRSNFTDVNANLSYAMQNPYADDLALGRGFQWILKQPADFVLVADRPPANLPTTLPATRPDGQNPANSANHDHMGQNVLYGDGRVEYHKTPLAGVDQDNIYLNRAGRQLESPADATDNVLLPPR